MTQKIKIAIGAAALVLLIAGASFAYGALSESVKPDIMLAEQSASIPEDAPQSPSEGTDEDEELTPERIKAPDFTVESSDGSSVKLSDLEGKPVVLNFWASWCPPCVAEMPEFDKVYSEIGSEITFMMVNMTDGQRETKGNASAYVSEQGFSFPVYYDTAREAATTYGIRSIPTTIFIDSEGFVATGAEGQISEETLRYGISLSQK